jgi:hypothetical protein
MLNHKILLSLALLYFIVTSASGQIFRVELNQRTDLMFVDAKKNSLIIFDDSIHYTQINLNTGKKQVLPYYRDPYDIFSEFSKGYKIITDKQNHVYFVDVGCGLVYKWQHDSIIRIDHSFHHKNQFNGDVFMHNGHPYIFGGYGYFLYKNMTTSFNFTSKEWYKVNTRGEIPRADLNRYTTKLNDKLNTILFEPNFNCAAKDVFSFDLKQLRWRKLGILNLKIRWADLCNKTEPSPFLVMKGYFYHLDYENNKISKFFYPGNHQNYNIIEVENKIIAFSTSPNSSGYEIMVYNKSDFFKNKVGTRPLLVPVVAPFNYSILLALGALLLVLLIIYLINGRRKNSESKPKDLKLYEFKKVELEVLNFWLTKEDLKIEMNEINDFVGQDNPSIDTLKKRRETLLKGLKQALEFYFKDELQEEKVISESHHPQDSRMKILIFNEKVSHALKNNKIGEKV